MKQTINMMGETINHLATDEAAIVAKHFRSIKERNPGHPQMRFIDRIYFAARSGGVMMTDKEFTFVDGLLQSHGLADLNFIVNNSKEGRLRQALDEEPFAIHAELGAVMVSEDAAAKAASIVSSLKRPPMRGAPNA